MTVGGDLGRPRPGARLARQRRRARPRGADGALHGRARVCRARRGGAGAGRARRPRRGRRGRRWCRCRPSRRASGPSRRGAAAGSAIPAASRRPGARPRPISTSPSSPAACLGLAGPRPADRGRGTARAERALLRRARGARRRAGPPLARRHRHRGRGRRASSPGPRTRAPLPAAAAPLDPPGLAALAGRWERLAAGRRPARRRRAGLITAERRRGRRA